jgi:hypothetical protein
MLMFTRLARAGFYLALFGLIAHVAISVRSMPYSTAENLGAGVAAVLLVALVIDMWALLIGHDAKVSFKEGWVYYVLIGLSIVAIALNGSLARFLWQWGTDFVNFCSRHVLH